MQLTDDIVAVSVVATVVVTIAAVVVVVTVIEAIILAIVVWLVTRRQRTPASTVSVHVTVVGRGGITGSGR